MMVMMGLRMVRMVRMAGMLPSGIDTTLILFPRRLAGVLWPALAKFMLHFYSSSVNWLLKCKNLS